VSTHRVSYQYVIINRRLYSLLFPLSKQRCKGQPCSQVIVSAQTALSGVFAKNTSHTVTSQGVGK